MTARLELEATYPHPPERVWRALVDPDAMAEWLMESDFEPVEGRAFRFTFESKLPGAGGEVLCEVVEIDPPRKMVWTWRDTWAWARQERPTTVTWTLRPEDGGTRLTLVHEGFEGIGPVVLSKLLRFGWGTMLKKTLPAAIAGGGESNPEPGGTP